MNKRIVLMYHDVYVGDFAESGFQNPGAIPYKISKESFTRQVSMIRDYCESLGIDESHIVFTFDDGGRSFLSVIAEILESYGFVGIFFISTAYIGTAGFLSVPEIVELSDRGHIIGTHSHTHPDKMDSLTITEMVREWKESTSILMNIIGKEVTVASVPNGYTSSDVYRSMVDNGITTIYDSTPTTKERVYAGIKIYGRFAITGDMSAEKVLGIIKDKKVRFVIQLRYTALGVAKKVLGDSYLKLRNFLLDK